MHKDVHCFNFVFFKKSQQCVTLKLLVMLHVIACSFHIICDKVDVATGTMEHATFACVQQVQFELGSVKLGLYDMCHLLTPCLGPPRSTERATRKTTGLPITSACSVIQFSIAFS